MTIYISGKITGNKNFLCDFLNAENKLKTLYPEAKIINPINTIGDSWCDYMKQDIIKLLNCSAIYMLKGWRRSKGARLEYRIAKALEFKIIYEV